MNDYEKKHVCNVETGEIELVDLTPEEIEQRDQERAADAAEFANYQPPKTEADELRELIVNLSQQVAELKKSIE